MSDPHAGETLAIAARLAEIEARAARGEWAAVRDSLADDAVVGGNAELSAFRAKALLRLGEPAAAIDWLAPRLPVFARQANQRAWRRTVNLAGAAAFELGRIEEAEEHFLTALEHATLAADHLVAARALNNLAVVSSTREQWSEAMNYYRLALPAYERTGSVRGIAECSHNIAATLLESGDLAQADEWERRAMELAHETGNDRLRGFALNGRADLALRRGDPSLAIVLGQQAANTMRPIGDVASEAHALRLVGQAQLLLGSLTLAEDTLRAALELAERASVVRVLAECRLALARCLLAAGRAPEARAPLAGAVEHFRALGAREKLHAAERLLLQVETGALGPPLPDA